jgi:hypothetical protein
MVFPMKIMKDSSGLVTPGLLAPLLTPYARRDFINWDPLKSKLSNEKGAQIEPAYSKTHWTPGKWISGNDVKLISV